MRESNMENLTLEQELVARVFMHKTAILGGVLMKNYIDEQTKGNVSIPLCMVEEVADQYSNSVMQKALRDGTFDSMYNDAWESIKEVMDEHTKVI